MVTQGECSKYFKKLCDWTVASRKKELRIAKDFSKLWGKYAMKYSFSEINTKQLNSVNLLLQKKTKNVERLGQLDKNREKELDHVKEQIRVLLEKIAAIRKNESEESERNKSLQLQLLHVIVLKTCTKTHINDRIPHLIRGFTGSEDSSNAFSFEIDSGRLTKNEIENAVWENSYRCSSYTNEWKQLFTMELGLNSQPNERE